MTSTDIQTMPSVAAGEQPNRWIPPLDKWEFVAWGAILVLAIVSRLWDLGGRGMHYDEVLHVWYSWLFVDGGGYQHNPLTHGPFLYHGNALLYWLLGANDVTGRLLPALFGIALVGLPFFFRKELNRYGALALGVLLLVSPMVLYFSRFSRNDVYMAVFVLALVLVMQRYSERRGTPLLFAWVVLWAFAFSSKETAFIFAGIFGLFLLLPSARHYWEWVRGRAKLSDLPPSGELFLVLATVSAPLWAPLSGLIQGIFDVIMVNPDAGAHGVVAGEVFRADAPTGAPVGGALYIAAVLAIVMFAVAAFLGLLWDRRRWPLLLSAFVAIWLPLHTSMFTNMEGFFTGLWGSLGYWIAQHGVERAGQPLYYYAITMSVYEFLILVPALAGGVYLVFKGKAFDIFLVYFALMNFILFSYAGERMPWLTVPIALSAALVAGRTIGLMVQSARRSHLAPAAFLGGLGLMVMVPFAFARAVGAESPLSDAGFWFALMGTVLVILGALLAGRQLVLNSPDGLREVSLLQRPQVLSALAAMGLGALVVMLGLTAVTSARAAYSYAQYERPTELLLYSQGGQEPTYFAQCLEDVAVEAGREPESLRFLVGNADNFAWQWRWYLRDYPDVEYRTLRDNPLTEPPSTDFVLISQVDEPLLDSDLDNYTRVGAVHHLWWFSNAAYAGLSPASVWRGATDRESLHRVSDYFFTRTWDGTPLHRSTGYIYAADELAPLAQGCTELRAAEES